MEITTIGIDLAKNVFQIHGANARGEWKNLGRHVTSRHVANRIVVTSCSRPSSTAARTEATQ